MKSRIGIYSAQGSLSEAHALGAGFESIGYLVSHRSLSDFGFNDRESIFNLVAVFGLRSKGRAILDAYRAAEVPVLVLDYGYLKREEYWQISLNGLNQPPPFDCPPRRFAELGLDIAPMREEGSGPTVLAGQLVGDQAHPFDTHKKWDKFVAGFPDIEYRPHPLMDPEREAEPLERLLARAGKIVTWNSNIGNDAMLAGVPVEAHAPDAMYKDVAPEKRAEYFARLACGQWTEEEMRDGSAARFVVDHILTGLPPTPVEASALPPVLVSEVDVREIRTVKLPEPATENFVMPAGTIKGPRRSKR